MTNEQLSILLSGLLAELRYTLDEVRDQMPEDAERLPKAGYRTPDGDTLWPGNNPVENLSLAMRAASGALELELEEDPAGDYLALAPLVALLDEWEGRFARLAVHDD